VITDHAFASGIKDTSTNFRPIDLASFPSYSPPSFPPPFPPHHTPNSPLTPYQIQIQNQSRLHRCPRFRRIHRFENSSLISCAALEAARGYVPTYPDRYLVRNTLRWCTFPASQIGVSAEVLRRKTKADARPKNNHGNRKNKALTKLILRLGMSLVRGTDNVNVL